MAHTIEDAPFNMLLTYWYARAAGIPLVLHGGSSVKQEYMLAAMQCGIAKINIGTEIRQVYEATKLASGSTAQAQDAVYARTCWLLSDYLHLAGTRPQLTA